MRSLVLTENVKSYESQDHCTKWKCMASITYDKRFTCLTVSRRYQWCKLSYVIINYTVNMLTIFIEWLHAFMVQVKMNRLTLRWRRHCRHRHRRRRRLTSVISRRSSLPRHRSQPPTSITTNSTDTCWASPRPPMSSLRMLNPVHVTSGSTTTTSIISSRIDRQRSNVITLIFVDDKLIATFNYSRYLIRVFILHAYASIHLH